jgi:hypothetical protein
MRWNLQNGLFVFFVYIMVTGLSVRQMVSIIINATVFEWLHEVIQNQRKRAERLGQRWAVFAYSKLGELFKCPLCLGSQLGIWVWGVPTVILLEVKTGGFLLVSLGVENMLLEILLGIELAFLLGMAVSGAHMTWWNISEYFYQRTAGLEKFREEQLMLLRRVLVLSSKKKQQFLLEREEFDAILDQLFQECTHTECPVQRANYISQNLRNFFEEKGWSEIEILVITGLINKEGVLPYMLKEWREWRGNPEFRDEIYTRCHSELKTALEI